VGEEKREHIRRASSPGRDSGGETRKIETINYKVRRNKDQEKGKQKLTTWGGFDKAKRGPGLKKRIGDQTHQGQAGKGKTRETGSIHKGNQCLEKRAYLHEGKRLLWAPNSKKRGHRAPFSRRRCEIGQRGTKKKWAVGGCKACRFKKKKGAVGGGGGGPRQDRKTYESAANTVETSQHLESKGTASSSKKKKGA